MRDFTDDRGNTLLIFAGIMLILSFLSVTYLLTDVQDARYGPAYAEYGDAPPVGGSAVVSESARWALIRGDGSAPDLRVRVILRVW